MFQSMMRRGAVALTLVGAAALISSPAMAQQDSSSGRLAAPPVEEERTDAYARGERAGEEEATGRSTRDLERDYEKAIKKLRAAPLSTNGLTQVKGARLSRQLARYERLLQAATDPRFDAISERKRGQIAKQYYGEMLSLVPTVKVEVDQAGSISPDDTDGAKAAYNRLRILEMQWRAATQIFPEEDAFEDAHERLRDALDRMKRSAPGASSQ